MDQLESINSTLLLRTCDLTGNIGRKSARNDDFTWNNIDMRSILRDEYDKYDYFELQLTNVCTGALQSGSYSTGHNKSQSIRMFGLPWVNSNYSAQSKTENFGICVGHFNMDGVTTSTGKVNQFSPNIKCCFGKTNTADITIQLFSLINRRLEPNTSNMPNPDHVFMFSIRGVKYEKLSAQLFLMAFGGNQANVTNSSSRLIVDMRSVLGTLWDEYEYFNIALVEMYATYNSAPQSGNNRMCVLTLKGLPFVNSTYNIATQHTNNIATIGYYNIGQSGIFGGVTQNGVLAQNTFSKCFNTVELIIDFKRISDNEYAVPDSSAWNAREFIFVITPVIK